MAPKPDLSSMKCLVSFAQASSFFKLFRLFCVITWLQIVPVKWLVGETGFQLTAAETQSHQPITWLVLSATTL